MSDLAADPIKAATRTLVRLKAEAGALRAELAGLRRDLAEARENFGDLRAAQLLEANEHLVRAALYSETRAETAANSLDELAQTSQRDGLTDTPNRALLLDRLESAIALARRRHTRVAVLFIDLDHFKPINDALGHAVGDRVLQWVARQLESSVRDSDTVSRYGGDEFVVLLTEVAKPFGAGAAAAKMLRALASTCRVGEHTPAVSASIGIALFPRDGDDGAGLIALADAAMYQAKKRSPGGFMFHETDEPDLQGEVPDR
ncbi:MAG: GGDEF domain-containing protein [Caldimonas sp.]